MLVERYMAHDRGLSVGRPDSEVFEVLAGYLLPGGLRDDPPVGVAMKAVLLQL
jgi:hypothetical protein